jgi:hypothetical protein
MAISAIIEKDAPLGEEVHGLPRQKDECPGERPFWWIQQRDKQGKRREAEGPRLL